MQKRNTFHNTLGPLVAQSCCLESILGLQDKLPVSFSYLSPKGKRGKKVNLAVSESNKFHIGTNQQLVFLFF